MIDGEGTSVVKGFSASNKRLLSCDVSVKILNISHSNWGSEKGKNLLPFKSIHLLFQASQPVGGVGGYRRRSSGQGAICDPELDDSGNKLVARLEDDAFISEQDLVSLFLLII